jgi:hypothetical protein
MGGTIPHRGISVTGRIMSNRIAALSAGAFILSSDRASGARASGSPSRLTRAVRVLLATVATLAVMPVVPAFADDKPIIQLSEDPFINPTSQHRTEVEPDTFAFGSTWVSTFQAGRFETEGASGTGFATSSDRGGTFVDGFLPGVTIFSDPPGSYARATDPTVAFDLRHHVWADLLPRDPRGGQPGPGRAGQPIGRRCALGSTCGGSAAERGLGQELDGLRQLARQPLLR